MKLHTLIEASHSSSIRDTIRTINSSIANEYKIPLSGRDINAGDCYVWAYIFAKIVNGARIVELDFENGEHILIQHNNKFYDAETTIGSDRLRDMHYIKRQPKIKNAKYITLNQLENTWLNNKDVDLSNRIIGNL